MKLKIQHEFEITNPITDTTHTGTWTEPTKKQVKEIEKLSPKKELKRLKELSKDDRTSKEQKEYEKLSDIVDGFSIEDIYQARLEFSMHSDNKADILEIAETYSGGYSIVFNGIMQSIRDNAEGND